MKTAHNNSTRKFAVAVLASTLTAAMLAAAAPALAAQLHRTIVLERPELKLGDIFSGAGEYADKVIGRAPEPGRRITLEPKWLAYVARSYNIRWTPISPDDRAVVERASQVVGHENLKRTVLDALKHQLPPQQRYAMHLENEAQQIHLPAEIDPTLSVHRINFDRRSNRFSATLVAAANNPQAYRFSISGKLYQMVEIPVVSRRVRRGDVIDRTDVEMILARADQVGADVVISADELIGKAPKRTLIENRPIRVNEVRDPILVKRGSIVTMIYQAQFMRISARGIAKTNGAEGDTVRIENSGSKKIVQGVVSGPGEVTVRLSRPVAMK